MKGLRGRKKSLGPSWAILEKFRARLKKKKTWAIKEREARQARQRGALQATPEHRQQQEQREHQRQDHEEQQGTNGESSERLETASPYVRVSPSSAAARPCRAV